MNFWHFFRLLYSEFITQYEIFSLYKFKKIMINFIQLIMNQKNNNNFFFKLLCDTKMKLLGMFMLSFNC